MKERASKNGIDNIGLVLSERARKNYFDTQPLDIIRQSDGRYTVTGCIEKFDMEASDVIDLLESLTVTETTMKWRSINEKPGYNSHVLVELPNHVIMSGHRRDTDDFITLDSFGLFNSARTIVDFESIVSWTYYPLDDADYCDDQDDSQES